MVYSSSTSDSTGWVTALVALDFNQPMTASSRRVTDDKQPSGAIGCSALPVLISMVQSAPPVLELTLATL